MPPPPKTRLAPDLAPQTIFIPSENRNLQRAIGALIANAREEPNTNVGAAMATAFIDMPLDMLKLHAAFADSFIEILSWLDNLRLKAVFA